MPTKISDFEIPMTKEDRIEFIFTQVRGKHVVYPAECQPIVDEYLCNKEQALETIRYHLDQTIDTETQALRTQNAALVEALKGAMPLLKVLRDDNRKAGAQFCSEWCQTTFDKCQAALKSAGVE